jgi:membrane complex biogenesis BtpA family protein
MNKRLALERLFGQHSTLIGVVHLLPLPGAPAYRGSMDEILERALADASALEGGGLDGAIVENFGDTPFFPDRVPPETVAAMTRVVAEIRRAHKFPIGINVLRNDAESALAIAAACDAHFVRVNVHVGAALTDQGIITGTAHRTLRRRRALWAPGREAPLLFCDVDVKHAAPLARRDLGESADETFHRGGADALLVTGSGTGREPDWGDLQRVLHAVPDAPVLVASGVTEHNVGRVVREAQGAIVGTSLKRQGQVLEPVDPDRVRALVHAARREATA